MLIAAVASAVALLAHPGPQAGAGGIQMRAVRFWVQNSKQTNVMAMVEVPYAIATPIGTGPSAYIAYDVAVTVKDADGKVLNQDHWTRRASAALRAENASGMEQLNFLAAPGVYWLHVAVTDSATSHVTRDSTRVDGYAASPGASDLMLASRIRATVAGDTTAEMGEISRGHYRIVTAPFPHIDITQPMMGVILEAYSPDSTGVSVALKVANADGSDMVPLPLLQKSIPAGGGLIATQFSLDGLPPGQYLLKAAMTVHGRVIERQAPFSVTAVDVALRRNIAESNANRGLDEVYFNSQPEDSLDAQAEELELWPDATLRERAQYKRDELSLAAKRRFLIEFWHKRDKNPSTPENETRVEFYNAVGYANQHFAVRFTPGWKTARGRIFAKYGLPDDSTSNQMSGRGIRYLVWRINRGKTRWFIFGDRSNNGNFVLLRSNEITEPGVPGWVELVTPEAARDIAQWLGLPRNYFSNG